MFSIFKKKVINDFSDLGVDLHSHLIPGIDDGSKSMEESIEMIRGFVDLGYKKIITTPHIMSEYYPNTASSITNGLVALKKVLAEKNIAIKIEAAAEYYADHEFRKKLEDKVELLSFSGNHVLIEFSMLDEGVDPFDVIFKLKTLGYIPIIAHPERYLYYAEKKEIFQKMSDQGCKLQVNMLSLTGHYGSRQKKLALQLLDMGIVNFLGSDCHHMNHLIKIKSLIFNKKIARLIKSGAFRNTEL